MDRSENEQERRRVTRLSILGFGIPVALISGIPGYIESNPNWAAHPWTVKHALFLLSTILMGIVGGKILALLLWKGVNRSKS